MSRKKKKTREKSITWIVVASMIVVAVFGWGVLASSYAGAHAISVTDDAEGGASDLQIPSRIPRRLSGFALAIAAIATFAYRSVEQIPNFPYVIGWHFFNRIWLPIAIVVIELLIVGGGFGLKALEKQLERPYRRKD